MKKTESIFKQLNEQLELRLQPKVKLTMKHEGGNPEKYKNEFWTLIGIGPVCLVLTHTDTIWTPPIETIQTIKEAKSNIKVITDQIEKLEAIKELVKHTDMSAWEGVEKYRREHNGELPPRAPHPKKEEEVG